VFRDTGFGSGNDGCDVEGGYSTLGMIAAVQGGVVFFFFFHLILLGKILRRLAHFVLLAFFVA
jgi:hypothetical protein